MPGARSIPAPRSFGGKRKPKHRSHQRMLSNAMLTKGAQTPRTSLRSDGGARGFDAHKRVKGRKRHILVDTLGLPVANRVEPANTSDRRAGALLLGGLSALFPRIRDGNSRCRPRKPQAGWNPEAPPRMAATNRQEATTNVQDHGSDMDRGT